MLLKEETIREIEEKIGYEFELKNLLVQAFIRRSFTNELPDYDSFDIENNEVLELLGDKVLDYIVVKKMAKLKGAVDFDFYNYTSIRGACSGMYSSSLNEGKLTDIKKSIVEKKSLAAAMSKLGLQKHLVMGKGDIAMNIQESDSVKEDLFEAILGAVAIDSDWNMTILERVLSYMYDIEDAISNAYVNPQIDKLWEEMFPSEQYNIHLYEFGIRDRIIAPTKGRNRIEWRDLPYKEEITICDKNDKILGCYFGVGEEQEMALNNAKLVAINDFKQTRLQSPICTLLETLTRENAVDKMNELCQKGLIEKQEEFIQNGKDEQGNPLWDGKLMVVNYGECVAYEFYSKKELKKEMSYCVLKEVRKLVKGKHDLFPLIYETLIKKEGVPHKGQVVAIIKDSSNAEHELKDLIKIKFEDGHTRRFVLDKRFVVEGNETLTSLVHSYYNEKGKNHTQEKEKKEWQFHVETNKSRQKEKLLGLVGARVWDEKLGKGTIIEVVNSDDLLIKMDNESRFASHMFSLDHIWENMAIEKEERRLLLGKVLCSSGYSIDPTEEWYIEKLIKNDERLFRAYTKLVFLKVGDYDFDNGEFPKTCQTLESYYKKLVDTLARERYYTKEEDAKHKESAYQQWIEERAFYEEQNREYEKELEQEYYAHRRRRANDAWGYELDDEGNWDYPDYYQDEDEECFDEDDYIEDEVFSNYENAPWDDSEEYIEDELLELEENEVDDVENDEEYLSFCNKMKEIDYNIAMIMDGVQ